MPKDFNPIVNLENYINNVNVELIYYKDDVETLSITWLI